MQCLLQKYGLCQAGFSSNSSQAVDHVEVLASDIYEVCRIQTIVQALIGPTPDSGNSADATKLEQRASTASFPTILANISTHTQGTVQASFEFID